MGDMRQIELEDEQGAEFGDPRRCPRHGQVTSSPDGMFDAPCGACEAEMDMSCDILDAGSESDYGTHGGYSEADEALLLQAAGPVDWDAEDYRDEVTF